jgi:uncharacterized protein
MSNNVRFPNVEHKLGLGFGMNMPWGSTEIGFTKDPVVGETITPKMRHFFEAYKGSYQYIFLAFQPKSRNRLRAEDYFPAYDELFQAVPQLNTRAFHQTMLNTGIVGDYDKREIIEFTNQLVERYDIKWIVEDLGIWSICGKVVPFPLPPFLTDHGLQACIRNIRDYQEQLAAPLCFEFAGFTEGSNFHVGNRDAFEFFRILAEETCSPVTIDIGHILSYQWLKGRTGERMYEGLEQLPLDHCFEFHLSGCQIIQGKYRDLHHGILLDEQIDLLAYLLPRCPNLKAITYEDPKYTDDGILVPKSQPNFLRMKELVEQWATN